MNKFYHNNLALWAFNTILTDFAISGVLTCSRDIHTSIKSYSNPHMDILDTVYRHPHDHWLYQCIVTYNLNIDNHTDIFSKYHKVLSREESSLFLFSTVM